MIKTWHFQVLVLVTIKWGLMFQDKDKTLPLGKLCLSRGDNLSGQPALRQGEGGGCPREGQTCVEEEGQGEGRWRRGIPDASSYQKMQTYQYRRISGNISMMNSVCEEGWESREAAHVEHLRSSMCSQGCHHPQTPTGNRHYSGISQTESEAQTDQSIYLQFLI